MRRPGSPAALAGPLLDQIPYGPKEIAQQVSDWVTALHLASARSGAEEFIEVHAHRPSLSGIYLMGQRARLHISGEGRGFGPGHFYSQLWCHHPDFPYW
jgi:hypothetical protein